MNANCWNQNHGKLFSKNLLTLWWFCKKNDVFWYLCVSIIHRVLKQKISSHELHRAPITVSPQPFSTDQNTNSTEVYKALVFYNGISTKWAEFISSIYFPSVLSYWPVVSSGSRSTGIDSDGGRDREMRWHLICLSPSNLACITDDRAFVREKLRQSTTKLSSLCESVIKRT